jgi:hypothetical protein
MLVCAGAVFAQEKAEAAEAAPGIRKNAITMDAMPLFRGLVAIDGDTDTGYFCMAFAYERLLAPHFTIGAEIDLYPGKMAKADYIYFSLAAAGRFYPMSEYMEKFFIGTDLGFNVQAINGHADAKYGGFAGLLIGLKAGYKLLFTDKFFMEPSMSYTYSKASNSESSGSDFLDFFGMTTPVNSGWQAGLRIGILF